MSDLSVKSLVRKRDGYRCVRCGMTEEDHQAKYSTTLEVHRIVPGCEYDPNFCVTLCHACHGLMPRRPDQLFYRKPEETGVLLIVLPLHVPEDRRVYDLLVSEAERRNTTFAQVFDEILQQWYARTFAVDYII